MIPLRDTIPSKNYPVVNTALIIVNVMVFVIEMAHLPVLNEFIIMYGLVPARYTVPEIAVHFSFGQQVFSLVSFMFLHGGFWHILGNMWFLYIFGDNVEDNLGHARYLLFYLLCGWVSGITHIIFNWYSQMPTIGASGAVAGVMGAYFILYPRAKVLTLIPILFIPYFIEIPAAFFLGIWFLIQFLSAALSSGQVSGIAWWAHIGGFIFGIVFLKIFHTIPETGITWKMRKATSRQRTPRLQVIKPTSAGGDYDLYGTLEVTPQEAGSGVRKLINIPSGTRKRLFRVTVPPGIRDGTMVRLAGIGRKIDDEKRGDVYLKVMIRSGY